MMYYAFIPIIVIGYVRITHMGILLSNKLCGRPNIGAWAGRMFGNIIIFVVRTFNSIISWPRNTITTLKFSTLLFKWIYMCNLV
ncbi:hypothetical protein C2G38_37691 [Gigaspora rosea]|uniref:Uncharacterized protein n=1 Tax=Gigaspora rosea TaxID=44941 RepID=A0A397VZN1_9GLOM|nr:hypothetical protein C2G38_37691 [Gigaspora rosea]